MYSLKRLRKFGMTTKIVNNFYRYTTQCVLTSSFSVYYGHCSAKDRKLSLQVTLEHLPFQGHQEGMKHHPHQGRYTPTTQPLHTVSIRQTLQKCEVQDNKIDNFYPQAIRLVNDSQHTPSPLITITLVS